MSVKVPDLRLFGLKSIFSRDKLDYAEQRFTGKLTRPDGSVLDINSDKAFVDYEWDKYIQVVGDIGPQSYFVFNIPPALKDGEYSADESGVLVAGPIDGMLMSWEGKVGIYRKDRFVVRFSGESTMGYRMEDLRIDLKNYMPVEV
ncbi:hypothetical protein ACJA3S_23470 [Pseudomonas sp. KnCO4]|uniref:hypothetical protein n=1 Tax=Pseudomonas sp. KnCO4 TaxID=3381355 RepID=UPI0038779A79